MQRRIDDHRAQFRRPNSVGDSQTEVVMTVEPNRDIAYVAHGTEIPLHIPRQHTAGGIHNVNYVCAELL